MINSVPLTRRMSLSFLTNVPEFASGTAPCRVCPDVLVSSLNESSLVTLGESYLGVATVTGCLYLVDVPEEVRTARQLQAFRGFELCR